VSAHHWKFVRVGGFDQVDLTTGADLVALRELDQKLWVALACPTKGLEFDARTLELVDTDEDGRIRAGELIAAAEWAGSVLVDVEHLAKRSSSIALEAIDASRPEGKLLRDTAKAILKSLGKPDAKYIEVADTKDALDAFAKQPFNGDGVVPADSASAPATKQALEDVLACAKGVLDKNGKPGITEALLESFFEDVAAHAAWLETGASDPAVQTLGDATADAFAAYAAVRSKLDDYFARCRVAAFDPRALAAVNGEEKEYLALAARDLDVTASEVAAFPLAQVAGDKPLPLDKGVNPAWEARLAAFRSKVAEPILDVAAGARSTLTEPEWAAIRARLAPHEAWVAGKKGASVERLGPARVRELATSDLRARLAALLAEDQAAEPLAAAIESVERLVRYGRDLLSLANNFVSFHDFYARKTPATFQVGTLYLDTRACELCVRVNDAAKHALMGPLASTYLIYCDCKNAKGEAMSIAVAMTAGDVDNLMVGRNGVFYDRKGGSWDATVTKLIDAPISVRQAFWSPYKKGLRMIEEYVARRAADSAAAADARVTGAVNETTTALSTGPAAVSATPARKPLDVGVVAAIGVAVGGITAAFGALLGAFFGLGIWMPFGVLGLMLAISGPSMAIAWLKLRKRNLGPILDANGWAVNAQAKINVAFGGSLTKVAKLPKNSSREVADPFADKRRPWRFYLVVAAILALAFSWYVGKVDRYLPRAARSTQVLGADAPASIAPPTSTVPSSSARPR
jgi:hypothetical protein